MLGANTGGEAAGAGYFNEVKWIRDLSRRPDGSFSYDEVTNYQIIELVDDQGSFDYWTNFRYYDMDATAMFVLQYAAPKKKLLITGKDGFNGTLVDTAEVAKSVWSGISPCNMDTYTTAQLLSYLNEFDPVVRQTAAIELGKRNAEHDAMRGTLMMIAANMNR